MMVCLQLVTMMSNSINKLKADFVFMMFSLKAVNVEIKVNMLNYYL